jgi:hypothetical protein
LQATKPRVNLNRTVSEYIAEARSLGVRPEEASAVLLLNLVRETHMILLRQHGPSVADEAIESATSRSLDAFPRQKLTLV